MFVCLIFLQQIEERCANLILTEDQLKEVCSHLLVELDRGLTKATNKEATIKCFPTYVRELPNGEGTSLSIYSLPILVHFSWFRWDSCAILCNDSSQSCDSRLDLMFKWWGGGGEERVSHSNDTSQSEERRWRISTWWNIHTTVSLNCNKSNLNLISGNSFHLNCVSCEGWIHLSPYICWAVKWGEWTLQEPENEMETSRISN